MTNLKKLKLEDVIWSLNLNKYVYIKIDFLDHHMGCGWVENQICNCSPFLFLFYLRKSNG